MNHAIKLQILEKIEAYDRIMLFRHIRPDGDCVGATRGLREILRQTWPGKTVLLVDPNPPASFAFLGTDDAPVPEADYADALGIVLDTASTDRIANPNYAHCRELIKLDHHIPLTPYGDIAWVEEERASCCEMVVDFWQTFRDRLKISPHAAACLYTGMVTDTGRFRYHEVNGETMRCAAALLDVGVDTDNLFAQLYLESYDVLRFKAHVLGRIQVTEHGVAHLFIDRATQAQFGLSLEQASACVSYMDGIRGCICWIAFIENGDAEGSVRVRLRSRFAPVNSVAEHYRGGGHAFACGATVYGQDEIDALLAEADALVRDYKATHDGWL
ncbi:MAG: bifunctional oligoribonuclease/PAP phosphatase NrnA [Clostridia bacterium]|nr:bifunctional oligoribonuclease/PAP phosphatase NrnA [Clostridia bacterium]